MGCGMSSTGSESVPSSPQIPDDRVDEQNMRSIGKPGETISVVFQRLDEEICDLESGCPGSRLSTVGSWIEHLESERDHNEQELQNSSQDKDPNQSQSQLNVKAVGSSSKMEINLLVDQDRRDSIKVIANKLDIAVDPARAKQHEEVFAKISKTSLDYMAVESRNTMIEYSQKRAQVLMQNFSRLKELYAELDGILATITGGTYVSEVEQRLDRELESGRQIRDKLGAVSEAWRISGTLLQASAKSSLQASESWNLVSMIKSPVDKINLGIDCRQHLHNSILAFSEAQNAVPQVEIPHVSPRQLMELQHTNLYLLTDMASELKVKQIKSELEIYQRNTNLALAWLHATYKKTMQKNFQDAESVVQKSATRLREERLKFINSTLGDKMLINPK